MPNDIKTNAKLGNLARTLATILGARWDTAGDLGTDINTIINLLNSIAGGTYWQAFGPGNVQVTNAVTLGVSVFDPGGGIIPQADITAGTYQIDQIRLGVLTNIVAPGTASSKMDGAVFTNYAFPAISWAIGDLFVVTFTGISVSIGGIVTNFPPIQVWGRVVMEPDIDSKVTTINTNQGNPSGDNLISTTLKLGNDTINVATRFANLLAEIQTLSVALGAGSNATLTRAGLLLRWLVDNASTLTSVQAQAACAAAITAAAAEIQADCQAALTATGPALAATALTNATWTDALATALSAYTAAKAAFLDIAISSREASGAAAAALAAVAYTRQAAVPQIKTTTCDLNQAAATYDLFTGTTQDTWIDSLAIRFSGGALAGAFTYFTIQTDDTTPQYFITAAEGVVGNCTDQNQLAWAPAGGKILLKAGKKIRLTIAVAAGGAARVCDVVCGYQAVVTGGYLA